MSERGNQFKVYLWNNPEKNVENEDYELVDKNVLNRYTYDNKNEKIV